MHLPFTRVNGKMSEPVWSRMVIEHSAVTYGEKIEGTLFVILGSARNLDQPEGVKLSSG